MNVSETQCVIRISRSNGVTPASFSIQKLEWLSSCCGNRVCAHAQPLDREGVTMPASDRVGCFIGLTVCLDASLVFAFQKVKATLRGRAAAIAQAPCGT